MINQISTKDMLVSDHFNMLKANLNIWKFYSLYAINIGPFAKKKKKTQGLRKHQQSIN